MDVTVHRTSSECGFVRNTPRSEVYLSFKYVKIDNGSSKHFVLIITEPPTQRRMLGILVHGIRSACVYIYSKGTLSIHRTYSMRRVVFVRDNVMQTHELSELG